MAGTNQDGAESQNPTYYWDLSISGSVTASTDQAHGGSYSYKFTNGSSGTRSIGSEPSQRWRFYLYLDGVSGTVEVAYRSDATPVAVVGRILINADRQIQLFVGNTGQVATSTYTVPNQQWFRLEFEYTKADVDGSCAVYVGNTLYASYTGDTSVVTGDIGSVRVTNSLGAALYVDDIKSGTAGSTIGPGWIYAFPLIADISAGLTGSDGDQVDNYALIGTAPPNPATYVYPATPGVALKDVYTPQAFNLAAADIVSVWCEMISLINGGESDLIEVGPKTYGTEYLTTVDGVIDALVRTSGAIGATNPYTGQPWTFDELQAMKIVLQMTDG